ncbi:4,5-DOPA dioxygenase extradiol [Heliophilum fasciatum]|nr:4,5-DOPA dioxygenase extradiol [Heliophilum fasciatum]
MPTLFIGHGSPMNAIEENRYTLNWMKAAVRMPKPEAILAISAHWYTIGTRIMDEAVPRMIYDMYGYPERVYRVSYQPKGAPEFAHLTQDLLKRDVKIDNSWGLDHGTWSVLCRMYPQADIPVYQLSVHGSANIETHFQIGRELGPLREKGVLILGSGNVVHNFSKINIAMKEPYSWAVDFDNYIKEKIMAKQYDDVLHYEGAGKSAELAFFTPEHFYPLLYILGASRDDDTLTVFNNSCTMGAMSMTSYLFE